MLVAIHQPHYFPWLGYLAKMASVDEFIFMDTVQLEKRSYMIRNRIIDPDGQIRYLSVSCEKHNHYDREYREIKEKDFEIWTNKQKGTIIRAYKRSKYFEEIWKEIVPIFDIEHEFLCDIAMQSIMILREIFEINTPFVMQSSLAIDNSLKKGKLILGICKTVEAEAYYAGCGASMRYLDNEEFEKKGIRLVYQNYRHPVYNQIGEHPFVSGLSALDLLFNEGTERARDIFWNSLYDRR